jgi:hypothetical protein
VYQTSASVATGNDSDGPEQAGRCGTEREGDKRVTCGRKFKSTDTLEVVVRAEEKRKEQIKSVRSDYIERKANDE